MKLTLSKDMITQAIAEYIANHNLLPGRTRVDVTYHLKGEVTAAFSDDAKALLSEADITASVEEIE